MVGAGNAGELLIRDMLSNAGSHYRPVGLVDDDPIKRKMKIHGVPVVGTIADIPGLARGLVAHEIIVAIPSASTVIEAANPRCVGGVQGSHQDLAERETAAGESGSAETGQADEPGGSSAT